MFFIFLYTLICPCFGFIIPVIFFVESCCLVVTFFFLFSKTLLIRFVSKHRLCAMQIGSLREFCIYLYLTVSLVICFVFFRSKFHYFFNFVCLCFPLIIPNYT